MPRIVICPHVLGFSPEASLLRALFERHPECFGEEFEPEDFGLGADASDAEVFRLLKGAVMHQGKLRFLQLEDQHRTLPWLLDQVQQRGGENCCWHGGAAKILEVPDDVLWHVATADDGSESVHEMHRVWK